jgi:type IV pilus biogenesis protein CpaD/CtpE
MIRIAIPVTMLIAGCNMTPPEETPTPPVDAVCDAAPVQNFVGQHYDAPLGKTAMEQAGAKKLRVIPPDTSVTMDYRTDRLNIHTDADGSIVRINCG